MSQVEHSGPEGERVHDPLAGFPHADKVRVITTAHVLGWLAAGWRDYRAAGWVSPAYGAMFVVIGFGITGGLAMVGMPYLIAPMVGAFLLIGPLLALGLYRISVDVGEGRRPGFRRAITAFRANPYHILTAGLILMLFVMIWARLSVVAFALFFPYTPMSVMNFLAQMISLDGLAFTVFITALGFGFAFLAFVTNVTALPMMLDRPGTDIFGAATISIISVIKNPKPMFWWAFVIVVVIGAGMLTAFIGLILALPLIGHASWHAYKDLVKPAAETE